MCKNFVFCIYFLLIMGCSAMDFGSSPLDAAIADNNRGCDYEEKGDYAKAVECYQKSADSGFYGGKANLARCYYYGIGVPKNSAYAVSLAIEPAHYGLAMAQLLLGEAMYFGIGTQQDVQNGYAFIKSAAYKGDIYARNLLNKINQAQWQQNLQQLQKQNYQYQLQLQQDIARSLMPRNTRQRATPRRASSAPDPKSVFIEDAPDKL